VLAGTPFESLTALREIEGVARPTAVLETRGFVGSATAPTRRRIGVLLLIDLAVVLDEPVQKGTDVRTDRLGS
jgi:hypothetical protein